MQYILLCSVQTGFEMVLQVSTCYYLITKIRNTSMYCNNKKTITSCLFIEQILYYTGTSVLAARIQDKILLLIDSK